MVANLVWEDLPNLYGLWGGSINQLENGSVEFDVNALTPPPIASEASEVHEVTQTSSPQVIWELQLPLPYTAYRAYRVPSLYPGVTWQN
jgi:arylsulfate sulfotransferase